MDYLEDDGTGTGAITIGGMLTLISSYFSDIDLAGLEIVSGSSTIDMQNLRAMFWLEYEANGDGCVWMVSRRYYAYLPNEMSTVIYEPNNWIFEADFDWVPDGQMQEDEEMEDGEENAPKQHQPCLGPNLGPR